MAKIEPFLRWAGGKRWLAKSLAPLLKERLIQGGSYIEPFLGSGAMFFAVQPEKAVLSDLNKDLIAAFKELAEHPEDIVEELLRLPTTREEYYRIRSWLPTSQRERAVRFIYLNRLCYGGIYRENRNGLFNVPYGGGERNHKRICSDGTLLSASKVLMRPDVEIAVCDFEKTLKRAGSGDIVYCDPTYREVTRKQFDRYGKTIFSWEDQERLARLAIEAYRRGAALILSNASVDELRRLYPEAGVVEVRRRKGLGPTTGDEGRMHLEYVFILDPLDDWPHWERLGPFKAQPGCDL